MLFLRRDSLNAARLDSRRSFRAVEAAIDVRGSSTKGCKASYAGF